MRWPVQILLCVLLIWVFPTAAQNSFEQKHLEVTMRMIGHQVLLQSGDSTSRVLPIRKEGDQYRIEFEAAFGFEPERLVSTIIAAMKQAKGADQYIVEVATCDTQEVVYGFEVNQLTHQDIVSCTLRYQPKGCYTLLITIRGPRSMMQLQMNSQRDAENPLADPILLTVIGVILFSGLGFIVFRRSKASSDGSIALGKYRFDHRHGVLILRAQVTELTAKETALLQLLHDAVNTTVKREDMLRKVWGDEGSYIGRTLDVFISKLRAKLQEDPSVKIVNIRGVGYKLVLGDIST